MKEYRDRGKARMTSASKAWCPVSQEHLTGHGARCPLLRRAQEKWGQAYCYSSSLEPVSMLRQAWAKGEADRGLWALFCPLPTSSRANRFKIFFLNAKYNVCNLCVNARISLTLSPRIFKSFFVTSPHKGRVSHHHLHQRNPSVFVVINHFPHSQSKGTL